MPENAVNTPTPTWTAAQIARQEDHYPQMIHGGEPIFVLAFLVVVLAVVIRECWGRRRRRTTQTKIYINYCANGLAAATHYPANGWDYLGHSGLAFGEPSQAVIDEAQRAGATVIAYDGDGMWALYQERDSE